MQLQGLAESLVDSGLLLREQAVAALNLAQQQNMPFVTLLVRQAIADSHRLAAFIAQRFGYPLLDLDSVDTSHLPHDVLETDFLLQHRVLPLFKSSNRFCFAFADPASLLAIEDIRRHTGLDVEAMVVDGNQLQESLQTLLYANGKHAPNEPDTGERESLEDLAASLTSVTDQTEGSQDDTAADAPLVRFVSKLLIDSVTMGASDIHIEPFENWVRIRCRIDGALRETGRAPVALAPRIISRLKVLAELDISERRVPQDGRLRLSSGTRTGPGDVPNADFRVNTMPTLWGEKMVLRLLDTRSAHKRIETLGYDKGQLALYIEALKKNQGLILVTGPTGSGKTVSLYAGLAELNTMERNIAAAEDPVEIYVDGINQIAINRRSGLDFATVLRAFMRQDPDVIMVGEIRDRETAEIAVKAAQTGHLVLTTLHTNSAAQSITRLLSMGIAPYDLSGSLSLIIAQRLVRRLCNYCKVPDPVPAKTLLSAGMSEAMIAEASLYKAASCHRCHQGYKGRVCIAEVLPMDTRLSDILLDNGKASDVASAAETMGYMTLRQSALQRAAAGEINLADAERINL